MNCLLRVTAAASLLLTGCNLGKTELGAFESETMGSQPAENTCERGDGPVIAVALALSAPELQNDFDVQLICTVDDITIESEGPDGPEGEIHRITNISIDCGDSDTPTGGVLSVKMPADEALPFEVDQVIGVQAKSFGRGAPPPLTVTIVSDEGEILFSYLQHDSVLAPEDALAGATCTEARNEDIGDLDAWLLPLGVTTSYDACREGELSLSFPDFELGSGAVRAIPRGFRALVEIAWCNTGEDGEHHLLLKMGYWRPS